MSDTENRSVLVRFPDYKMTYADTFTFRVTGVDFTLTFGAQNSIATEQGQRIDATIEQTSVTMTLQLAKALAVNLRKIISVIEQEIGPIPTGAGAIIGEQTVENIKNAMRANPLITKGIAEFDDLP